MRNLMCQQLRSHCGHLHSGKLNRLIKLYTGQIIVGSQSCVLFYEGDELFVEKPTFFALQD